MTQSDDKLTAIAAQLKKGIAPTSETVRSFLLWFGSERRGFRVVRHVRFKLKKHGLVTTPDFEYAYIDSLISFKLATTNGAASEYESGTAIADALVDWSRQTNHLLASLQMLLSNRL